MYCIQSMVSNEVSSNGFVKEIKKFKFLKIYNNYNSANYLLSVI